MFKDDLPLNKKERAVVGRALLRGYLKYRDATLRAVCKGLNIALRKHFNDESSGRVWITRMRENIIEIPGKSPPKVKEHTFWHEVGHVLVSDLDIFPSFVGYHAYVHSFSERHWSQERTVEAFAIAMSLYRSGIDPGLEQKTEEFLFADQASDSYVLLERFEAQRILKACEEAESKRINSADTRGLRILGALMEKYGSATDGLQQDLPMRYEDTHREAGFGMKYHYVGWYEDMERNRQLHEGKESWRETYKDEQRLLRFARSAHTAYAEANHQGALFPERAKIDQARFKKLRARFERALNRFKKT